ncbi:fluoride efflux transporter FluC [Prochlorococcus marinus]|uniref:Fluoride-specific ion channel FluC 2 n=1 Tax=Prochlorococcus marinus (strain SARG / CCMP1375 / SS120) TaxID=167539 RepID=FLUC2_PROMA|nr:CrcB family protein [Prochlorococcus marinus]Q7V9N5.1 RecName: Full=Fluoride-specific ion channel FluC 2 [Prochlorococcus marinus subsp. marinus str. CCMP1375]AAQ00838.1 Conserved membrane protein [Prochlorococcus marinus subsp. marinus str. CCMP1375]
MFDGLSTYKSFFLVAFGAVPGAICRMKISDNLFRNKHNLWGILLVNSSACLLLGFFLAKQNYIHYINNDQPLYLLLCVGFLGSFSTFSSLILEIYYLFVDQQWMELFLFTFTSIGLGIIFISLGSHLFNA